MKPGRQVRVEHQDHHDSKNIIPNKHKQDQTKRRIISMTVVY